MKVFIHTLWSCLWCIFTLSNPIAAEAQEVHVEHNVPASPVNGLHEQYEMHVDPDSADNMILCGWKIDAKDNAFYGYVYSSSDQGKTWRIALEPKNSRFESEESCAYGVHGVAYYVTSASKVIDDNPHHEQGTTRIYVSHDSGKTWKLGVATGWNDWTTSVVDTAPGPNQNRLYSYFNGNLFHESLGQTEAAEADLKQSNATGSWLSMISYKDGDPQVGGPFRVSTESQEKYIRGGSFPGPALLLKSGTILTLYSTKRRTEKNIREIVIESSRTISDGTALEPPVKVVSSLDNPDSSSDMACGGYYLEPAAAYDAMHDKVYFAYSDIQNKKCVLFLKTSTDEGKSWSKPQRVYTSVADGEQEYASPAIAINKDGLMAVMWQKTFRSGCWMFATSVDDGKSLSRATPLGTCAASEIKPSKLTTANFWTSFFAADPKYPNSTARINLRNTRADVGRNQDAIAVTPDGAFHPVWSDPGNGEGELRTAEIRVTPAATLIANATPGLADVTSRLAVLYGGDQFYDPKTKVITLDVVIKNNSDKPLIGPFKLAVPDLYKDYGFADIANASNGISDAGAVWDISSSVPGGSLAPGTTTKPFALKFHYLANPDTPRGSDDILGLSVKVYAAK